MSRLLLNQVSRTVRDEGSKNVVIDNGYTHSVVYVCIQYEATSCAYHIPTIIICYHQTRITTRLTLHIHSFCRYIFSMYILCIYTDHRLTFNYGMHATRINLLIYLYCVYTVTCSINKRHTYYIFVTD
jgi:hypothetical protein